MPALTAANELVRSQNVTASEVAALLPGGHPYSSPSDIYDRLTLGTRTDQSEPMAIGSWFEPYVLRYAKQRDGFRARANRRTFEHPIVRLCATPDAFLIGRHPTAFVPERALVEIKVSGNRWGYADKVPGYVEWQCRAQMACTDRDAVYVYALVGTRLERTLIYRDAGLEAQLVAAVQTFWADHIVPGIRPEPAIPVQIPATAIQYDIGA